MSKIVNAISMAKVEFDRQRKEILEKKARQEAHRNHAIAMAKIDFEHEMLELKELTDLVIYKSEIPAYLGSLKGSSSSEFYTRFPLITYSMKFVPPPSTKFVPPKFLITLYHGKHPSPYAYDSDSEVGRSIPATWNVGYDIHCDNKLAPNILNYYNRSYHTTDFEEFCKHVGEVIAYHTTYE
jgi:hypothetical protein